MGWREFVETMSAVEEILRSDPGELADMAYEFLFDEAVHFIDGRSVRPEDDSYYDLPERSEGSASLYEHCIRAILNSLKFGEHGLPLIGSCDWNDGMNLVGEHGKGESVWLGFFLYKVLMQFAEVAHTYGDLSFVERCRDEAAGLRRNLDRNGWVGGQSRMPDRFDCAELVRPIRCGRS
jgi:cyclic beta-1,2-glucan synthetase